MEKNLTLTHLFNLLPDAKEHVKGKTYIGRVFS